MVPENIIWAFFSAFDYQQKYESAVNIAGPLPKDIYYKNTNGEWVKTTAVFSCIDEARRNYRLNDAKYLGPVLENTKVEVDRGSLWPKPPKEKIEEERKAAIRKRLGNIKRTNSKSARETLKFNVKDADKETTLYFPQKLCLFPPEGWEDY